MTFDKDIIKKACRRKCPRCGEGQLFPHWLTLDVKESCEHCDLDLARQDSGDGPAVFLIFILGFLLVPGALFLDSVVRISLFTHVMLWTTIAIGICLLVMQPLKALVIGLNFKHRNGISGV